MHPHESECLGSADTPDQIPSFSESNAQRVLDVINPTNKLKSTTIVMMCSLHAHALHPWRRQEACWARSTFLRHLIITPLRVSSSQISFVSKALQNGHAGTIHAQQSSRNDDREEILWQRQQQLWDREMQRWDAERLAWTEREHYLLQQIADLQALLVRGAVSKPAVATNSTSSVAQPLQKSTPEKPHAEGPSEPPQSPITSQQAFASIQTPESTSQHEEQYSTSNELFNVSDLQALYGCEAAEMGEPSWAADFANAMAAVNCTDVLDEEAPFKFNLVQPLEVAEANNVELDRPLPETSSQSSSFTTGGSGVGREVGGSPPTLSDGSDHIFWVNQLHRALDERGFSPGDEEIEMWFFGNQTLSALLTFQASVGLPETGACDEATWNVLLGPETIRMRLIEAAALDLLGDGGASPQGATAGQGATSNGSLGSQSFSGGACAKQEVQAPSDSGASSQQGQTARLTSWPVLHEGEGGAEVHGLQIALNNKGYYCGEDDCVWWQFGMDTYSSLLTFQACNGLSETGVSDAATWEALLGPDACPSDVLELKSGDDTDDDLQEGDTVWLLGEQRWEVRR